MDITDEKDSSKAFYLISVNFVLLVLVGVIACIYEQQNLITLFIFMAEESIVILHFNSKAGYSSYSKVGVPVLLLASTLDKIFQLVVISSLKYFYCVLTLNQMHSNLHWPPNIARVVI